MKILFTLLIFIWSTQACGQTKFFPPQYPWHFLDIWWEGISDISDFQEISVDFRIVGEVPNTVDLYIAPLGLFKIGATSFYGGVQTNIGGWPTKFEQRRVEIGRGGIFSRWSTDASPIPLSAADGAPDTHYESASYEGAFISVRRHVNWTQGWYTYTVMKLKVETGVHPMVWFGAYLLEHASGIETYLGSLRLDQQDMFLDRSIAAFVEIYGDKSVIPQLTVVFSAPKVDGRVRPYKRIVTSYPQTGLAHVSRFATATRIDDSVYISVLPAGIGDGVHQEELY